MKKVLVLLAACLATIATTAIATDYFDATGIPVQRSTISSAEFRTEFAAIETGISDKLPPLVGNGNNWVRINAGGTAMTSENTATLDAALNLSVGTDVQAWDTQLDDIAALAVTDSNFMVGDGANWVAESGATARASMGANSAANLNTGELPDARLSSNVPLLDQSNLFAAPYVGVTNTAPGYRYVETGVTADNGNWMMLADTERFVFRAYDDAFSAYSSFMLVFRTGTTISSIQLDATTLDVNGNADISGNLVLGDPLAIAEGGTASTTAAAASTALGVGTTNSPEFLAVNVGAATDTTLTRLTGGVLGVEGEVVPTQTTGSFSVDFDDACTTTPSYTWNYVRHGNIVSIDPGAGDGTCTSDSSNFQDTSTPVPAAIRPTGGSTYITATVINDTAQDTGCVILDTDGTVRVLRTTGAQCNLAWTASGTKSAWIGSFSYILH